MRHVQNDSTNCSRVAKDFHLHQQQQHQMRWISPSSTSLLKLGLAKLEFRDQLFVFVDGSLGIRQGIGGTAMDGLRFRERKLRVEHSYYWRCWEPEEHKNQSVGQAAAHASQLERGVGVVEVTSLYNVEEQAFSAGEVWWKRFCRWDSCLSKAPLETANGRAVDARCYCRATAEGVGALNNFTKSESNSCRFRFPWMWTGCTSTSGLSLYVQVRMFP